MSVHDELKPGWRLLGPSTKPQTLVSGETVVYTKEALEKVVDDAKTRFIPTVVEHLNFLPPIGRVSDAELVEHEGHFWLALRDQPLAPGTTHDLRLPVAPDEVAGGESTMRLSVTLSTEPRNFEPRDFSTIKNEARTEIGEISLHSELPPIIWSFILVLGGLGFAGAKAFVTEFYKQLGAASAEEFITWLKNSSSKVKEPHRDQLAEFRIQTTSGVSVVAYCSFSPEAARTLTELSKAIDRIADVALFVATAESEGVSEEVQQMAFFWDDDAWRLAWWASANASYVTPWLETNAPDPSRFLGGLPPSLRLLGPYLPGLPGASTPEAVGPAESDLPGQNTEAAT